MQFAVGRNVSPDRRAIVRITSRFRGTVLRELLRLKTGDDSPTWTRVGRDVRKLRLIRSIETFRHRQDSMPKLRSRGSRSHPSGRIAQGESETLELKRL